jgi:hypothetical protein
LILFQLGTRKYRSVRPNEQGRHTIDKLNIEVALLDGWVRFWYEGELLPLPADMQRELDDTRRQLQQMAHHAEEQTRRADEEHQARLAAEQELIRLRAEVEQMRKREE